MVVRFPSESESESDAGRGPAGDGTAGDGAAARGAAAEDRAPEQLAPVTYLPRSRGADHPSRLGRGAHTNAAESDSPRPVVAFPSTGQAAADSERAAADRKRTTGLWSKAFLEDSTDDAGGSRGDDASDSGDEPERGGAARGTESVAEKQVKRASNVSIHQLARRGMSRWELEQVLAKREIDPAVAQAELDRLESVGLLDDAALAVTLVYTQHNRKGLGRSAIAQELNRRHIAPELIEEALAEIADDDELERATELAMKRVGQLSTYDDETAKRRLHGFLARKGYSSAIVRQAMDAALATRGRRGGVRFQ
ncbi:regulatory protein RecX [Leifsonia sp. PS1209]|uniref:regulatory protein RecX n=1 Tax=Leifsonia sp. PS1209 TaxID=2724914 RepID=UPI001FF8F9CB|nr:regulatory protein RecX [Leifsonia sp. PS1209]